MAEIILAETASTSTPSAGKVSFYADNTANPQLKFKDDGGNTRTVADDNNTVVLSNKTFLTKTGYDTGAGGTQTQGTSKTTAFTLSKLCGTITFNNSNLAADTTTAGATWTNTFLAAGDIVLWQHISGGTLGAYAVTCNPTAGSATVYIRNLTPGALAEAPVFTFIVIKAVTA